MKITLEPSDVAVACSIATHHSLSSVLRDRTPKNKQSEASSLDDRLVGYLAEIAVARALGVSWPQPHKLDFDRRHDGDLFFDGEAIEVRSSSNPNAGFLLGQPDDDDGRRYFFVRSSGSDFGYEVMGWMRGSDMKDMRYWADKAGNGRFCYWVPVEDLVAFDLPF